MKLTSVAGQEKKYVKDIVERVSLSGMDKSHVITRLFFLADHNIQYTNIRTILSSISSLVFFAHNSTLSSSSYENCDLFLHRKK